MDQQTQQKLLNLVRENYDEIAVSFNTTRTKYLWPGLVKLTAPVKDSERILDVGCGNGRLLQALADKEIEYLGIDDSVKLIEAAKKNCLATPDLAKPEKMSTSLRSGDWRFINGNILKLNKLPEKDFNYVFCVAVLHHLPGEDLRVEALRQMKEKIGANGQVIITVWNLWSQDKYKKLIFKTFLEKILRNLGLMSRRCGRDPDFALRTAGDFGDILFNWKNNQGQEISRRYYHAFTRRGLKKIAVKAGLKVKKLYKDEYNYYLILKN